MNVINRGTDMDFRFKKRMRLQNYYPVFRKARQKSNYFLLFVVITILMNRVIENLLTEKSVFHGLVVMMVKISLFRYKLAGVDT